MPCLYACILVFLLTVTGMGVGAELSVPAVSAATTVAVAPAPSVTPPAATDLRDVLAATTSERDHLLIQVERLQQQRIVFIVVAGLLALAVGLLVRARLLVGRPKKAVAEVSDDNSDPFPEAPAELVMATTVTVRKNATITIRNGATQREEVSGQVQTRRFFSGDTRKTSRRESTVEAPREEPASPAPVVTAPAPTPGTKTIVRSATNRIAAPIQVTPAEAAEPDLCPSTDRVSRPAGENAAASQEGSRRPVTVRVDHQSDRLDVVEVTVKPGTTGIYRRQGFTLLEVMVSMALLATVLSSVIGSIYTMHRTRVMAQEEAESQALGRLFVERIMAEPWGNLHSGAAGSFWKANYADDASAVPLTAQALRSAAVVEQLPALNDLKVFIEYYPQSALENAIRDQQPMVLTNRLGYRDRTMVFRIVIVWQGYDGGLRRHVQLFARSE